jgi:hypothetical protein
MSDYKGAAKMINAFPMAKTLLADKGYDADWFRDALLPARSPPAFHLEQTARSLSRMIRCSTKSATRSKTCSAD